MIAPSHRRRWTAEQDATIRDLAGDTPHAVIADVVGRSVKAVSVRASVLGVARGKSPASVRLSGIHNQRGVWVEGVGTVESVRAAAELLGVVPSTVSNCLARGHAVRGVRVSRRKPRKPSDKFVKRAGVWCALTPRGELVRRPTGAALAEKLGVVPSAVFNALRRGHSCVGCRVWVEPQRVAGAAGREAA